MSDSNAKFKKMLQDLWEGLGPKDALSCQMKDGQWSTLISGPSHVDKGEQTWKYAFQVRGESSVRWLNYNEIQIINGIAGTYLRQVG